MRYWAWVIGAAAAGLSARSVLAEIPPVRLALDEPESVYPQATPMNEADGLNLGAVNFSLDFSYLTDYVYRGLEQSQGDKRQNSLQFDGLLKFDTGGFPHPFLGLFANVFNDDPVSRFEEIRPFVGVEWTIKPFIVSAGHTNYLYPNRQPLDTAEIWARVQFDDSVLFNRDTPLLSPYVYGAYDYDLYHGTYLEGGIKHDFVFKDYGITITPFGNVGFVLSDNEFRLPNRTEKTGFQHYEVGLIGTYSLNQALNLPHRYGEWKLKGYLLYDDGINNRLRADTRFWGGGGISFEY